MNITLVALLVAAVLGIGVFPWRIALQHLTIAEFFVIQGTTYLLGGLIWRYASNSTTIPSSRGIFIGLGTCLVYFVAMSGCNYIFANTNGLQMAVATAITAAYPIVTALVAVILARKMFAPSQVAFLLMAVVGVVGLSFTGSPK